jgi:molybdopterin-synthase adenylyltransferase
MLNEWFSRQSFLGARATQVIERARIGIIGLGGGGSHVVQQLAHVGFRRFVLYDPDAIEESNLNRLVGATRTDVLKRLPKAAIARRIIDGLHQDADIVAVTRRWQEQPGALRGCDLLFGCLDGLQERSELEVCARRFLVPYVDVGLGVRVVAPEPPRMSGQVVLSMPGAPCFRCMGFLNERDLAEEALRYGDAGPRPQVVWANGVLAATAVGIAVAILTGWTRERTEPLYLVYDGNENTVRPHPRISFVGTRDCPHFPPEDVGEPSFARL